MGLLNAVLEPKYLSAENDTHPGCSNPDHGSAAMVILIFCKTTVSGAIKRDRMGEVN